MAVIRQQTQVFNKPVGVRRINTGEAELWETIKAEADEFTRRAYNDAAENAQKVGKETALGVDIDTVTTINPITGKPEAFDSPEGFGKFATDAYQKVITARYQDSIDTEMDVKAKELGLKYEFDPKGYETAMSQYISSMAENAEGSYKQYIAATGAKKLAYEKLNVQNRTRTHHRKLETEYIYKERDLSKDRAYNEALVGNFDTAVNIIHNQTQRTNDGIVAKLLPDGTALETQSVISIATGKGLVEYAMNQTSSEDERNIMQLYLATKGKKGKIANKKIKDTLDNLLLVMDVNTRADILNHFSVTSNNFDTVDRDNAANAAAAEKLLTEETIQKAKIESKKTDIAYDKQQDHVITSATQSASNLFSDDVSLNDAASSLYHTIEQFNSLEKLYNERTLTDEYFSDDDKNKEVNLVRKEIIKPFILQAAQDGNVDYLQSAIINDDDLSRSKLTGKQLLLVDTLRETNIDLPESDVKSILGLTVNPTEKQKRKDEINKKEKIKKEKEKASIYNEIESVVDSFAAGAVSSEDLQNELTLIDSYVGTSLTATEAQAQKNRIKNSAAYGQIRQYGGIASGDQMKQMSLYLQTNGENTDNMSNKEIELGEKIKENLTETSLDTAHKLASSIGSKISQREQAEEKIRKEKEVYNTVLQKGGDHKNTKYRQATDEILENMNLSDYENFETWPTKKKILSYEVMSHIPPESLISKLNDIVNGTRVPNGDALMDHFMRLDNHLTSDGITSSRFAGIINMDTRLILKDINQIRITQGGDVTEIATTLIQRRNDPKSDLNLKNTLGFGKKIKSVEDFVFNQVDDHILTQELAPMVEYMARTGRSQDDIIKRLDQIIDEEYPEVEYVADPRFVLGTMKRSRYGLHATFPDDKEREEFISRIESQLPSGYSMHAKKYEGSISTEDIPEEQQGYFDSEDSDYAYLTGQKKQVYLVPDETAVGVTYYAYYVDEYKELKPLIYGEGDNKIFPMFDKDETADFRIEQALKRKTELETEFTNAQKNNQIILKANYHRNRKLRK